MANSEPAGPVVDDLHILDDPKDAYTQLEEEAGRLFIEEGLKVLVWPNDSGKQLSLIIDSTALDDYVQDYKAQFFKPAISDKDSFYVRFGDSQLLHRRRQKLLKSFAVLETCISVAQGYQHFCRDFDKASQTRIPQSFYVEIELYIAKMQAHKRAVNLLLKQSAGTLKLLFQVLQFRNDEAFAKSNSIMEHNSHVLTNLGTSAREENKAIIVLTEQGRTDSRFMKILTFIAVLFLPAGLVAVRTYPLQLNIPVDPNADEETHQSIFNSGLIVSVNDGEASMQTHFKPATQFWIYPVSTVLLMCVTTVPVVYLGRRKSKKDMGMHSVH
ncbi:MAG: hypothetical protein Q9187_001524 [Circinaria calcarea]